MMTSHCRRIFDGDADATVPAVAYPLLSLREIPPQNGMEIQVCPSRRLGLVQWRLVNRGQIGGVEVRSDWW
jgi:hypothetical protein